MSENEGDTTRQQIATLEAGHELVTFERATIDQQIATAKRFPRRVQVAMESMTALAIITPEAARTMIYTLPRSGKDIEGPSVRLAEIIHQCWGNARVSDGIAAVNRAEGYVEAFGEFHDLETNSATRTTTRRRITDSMGRLYSNDMIVVTGNAARSIARRNAILAGVPKAVYMKAYEAAAEVCGGTMQTLGENLDAALQAFKLEYNIEPARVYAALGISGEADVGLKHIRKMRGMYAALKNEEATVGELFSPRTAEATEAEVANPLTDDTGKGDGGKGKPGKPKTAAQYIEHATKWIAEASNEPAARRQWRDERTLREACGVSAKQREPLEAALETKFAK